MAVKSLKEEGRTAQTFLTEASVMTLVDHLNFFSNTCYLVLHVRSSRGRDEHVEKPFMPVF